MFKNKRRKELERAERELYILKQEIKTIEDWCAADSGEIAFAMLHLKSITEPHVSVSVFRDNLRKGQYTFNNYLNKIGVKINHEEWPE